MTSSTAVAEPRLLSLEQQTICERLSTIEIEDVSLRAQALLLLEGGSTQPEAAEQSGLSIGQIRYMVKRFKEKGLDMFPAELLQEQDEQPADTIEQIEEQPTEPQPVVSEPSAPESNDTEVEEKKPATEETEQKTGKKKKRKKASKKRIKPQKPVKKKKSKRKRKKNKNRKG